jgi:hypothetical protein
LGNVSPVRGSADGSQVELSRTGSPAAGDSESGQHCEVGDEGGLIAGVRLEEEEEKKNERRSRIT